MKTVIYSIREVLRFATGVAFVVLMASVTVQVVARTFIGGSPIWTEELTRYGLLYMAALGTGLSLFTGDLVNVDLVSESLPGRLPWLLRLLSAVLILVFCLPLIGPAWQFTKIGTLQTSPAIGMPMQYVHVTVLILLALLALAALMRIVGMLAGTTDGKPEMTLGDRE